jgi:hypothetical protein
MQGVNKSYDPGTGDGVVVRDTDMSEYDLAGDALAGSVFACCVKVSGSASTSTARAERRSYARIRDRHGSTRCRLTYGGSPTAVGCPTHTLKPDRPLPPVRLMNIVIIGLLSTPSPAQGPHDNGVTHQQPEAARLGQPLGLDLQTVLDLLVRRLTRGVRPHLPKSWSTPAPSTSCRRQASQLVSRAVDPADVAPSRIARTSRPRTGPKLVPPTTGATPTNCAKRCSPFTKAACRDARSTWSRSRWALSALASRTSACS